MKLLIMTDEQFEKCKGDVFPTQLVEDAVHAAMTEVNAPKLEGIAHEWARSHFAKVGGTMFTDYLLDHIKEG